jgi:hypothetical protein
MRIPRGRGARIALGTASGIVVVLGLAQLVLPGLAAQRVRDQLGRYGVVRSATVNAFPAIELLWGHAQSATVRAGSLGMSASQAGELLWKARGVQRMDLSAESMRVGSLAMRDVSTEKRGQAIYTQGSLGEAQLRASLPGVEELQLLGSAPGGVEVRVSGSLFGVRASVDALLSVQEGKLVAQPQGVPLAGFVKLTVISDPHTYLRNFDLTRSASSGGDPTYRMRIWATLR